MKKDREIMSVIIFFCQVTSVKAAIGVSEWTRNEMSGMKLNADVV